MSMAVIPAETVPLARPAPLPAGGRRQGRHHHARPAGAEESAHLRFLRRAARPLPRRGQGRGRQGGRHHRRRRQLLLRRRRARDHRAADQDGACAELLAFTRMTGDLVKAMRACPQPIVAAVDGVCAGAGAILAHGVRPALRHARRARSRSCSRASGSPAATWAPARCCRGSSARAARPSCSTPAARWAARRRERWGFFNAPRRAGRAARARRTRWPRSSPTARPSRTRMTKTMLHQEWEMGLDRRSRRRRRRRRSACRPRISAAPTSVRRQAEAGVRGQLMMDRYDATSTGRSSRRATARSRASARALGRRQTSPTLHDERRRRAPAARWSRRSARPAGCATSCRAATAAHAARRALALPRPRDARLPRGPRRLRVRHAGAGQRRRSRSSAATAQQRALPAARCARARRSPPSRCPSRRPAPTSRRWRPRATRDGDALRARRREDLDLQRRHRRLLRRLRAHRRGAGRQGHLAPSSSTPTRRASRSPSASR